MLICSLDRVPIITLSGAPDPSSHVRRLLGVFFSTPPCCPPTGVDGHRLCTSNPGKKPEFNMTLLSYIITFITGVAVGFVFSVVILFRKRLDGTTEQMDRSREVT